MRKKRYNTLSVNPDDLIRFREIAKKMDMKQVDLFSKVVNFLEKKVNKEEGNIL